MKTVYALGRFNSTSLRSSEGPEKRDKGGLE
jgi:hypothetical protein